MQRVNIKPRREGKIVRDTDGSIIPQEGKLVPLNTYWSRRLKAQDVVLVVGKKKKRNDEVGSLDSLMSKNKKPKPGGDE